MQYRKSLAFESSLKLLDSIALVAAAPESIDRALADKVGHVCCRVQGSSGTHQNPSDLAVLLCVTDLISTSEDHGVCIV